jgi:hypothetical protein
MCRLTKLKNNKLNRDPTLAATNHSLVHQHAAIPIPSFSLFILHHHSLFPHLSLRIPCLAHFLPLLP